MVSNLNNQTNGIYMTNRYQNKLFRVFFPSLLFAVRNVEEEREKFIFDRFLNQIPKPIFSMVTKYMFFFLLLEGRKKLIENIIFFSISFFSFFFALLQNTHFIKWLIYLKKIISFDTLRKRKEFFLYYFFFRSNMKIFFEVNFLAFICFQFC